MLIDIVGILNGRCVRNGVERVGKFIALFAKLTLAEIVTRYVFVYSRHNVNVSAKL
jgi:hypothetical protein